MTVFGSWVNMHENRRFPGGSAVKNLPAVKEMWKTRVQSLGQEDPLEDGMATHCSILAWRIPWTEDLGRLQSMGLPRVRHDCATFTPLSWGAQASTTLPEEA